jgi:hypothetical protein
MQLHLIVCTYNLVSETANFTPVTPSLLKIDIPCSRWYKTGKQYLCEYVCLLHFHLLSLSLSLSLYIYIYIYIVTKLPHYRCHTTNGKLISSFVFSTLLTQAALWTSGGFKTSLHILHIVMLLIDQLKFIYLTSHVQMHRTQYFILVHVVH